MTEDDERHRLTAIQGLAALSLDALSSVAYGPEAILVVLVAAGAAGLRYSLPVTGAIIVLLAALVPAPGWLGLTMVALILCGSIFTVAAYADDIRATRLRQHGLDVPDDPDLGHPAH